MNGDEQERRENNRKKEQKWILNGSLATDGQIPKGD